MRVINAENLSELLKECHDKPGFIGGLLLCDENSIERMETAFRDMIGGVGIYGVERIECDKDIKNGRKFVWLIFNNGSYVAIMTASHADRYGEKYFDRILYDTDVSEMDRLQCLYMENIDIYDPERDWIPTLQMSNMENMDDYYYVTDLSGILPVTTTAYTTQYPSAYADTSYTPDHFTTSTFTTGYWPAGSYSRANLKRERLKNAVAAYKKQEEIDEIDDEAFDSFMKKLENGEELA